MSSSAPLGPSQKKRVAVLISGGGTNLQALLDASSAPDYPAEIVLVISNNPDAYGLTRAEKAGVAFAAINHRNFASRSAFEESVHASLIEAKIELVCLAGFMRILSAGFVNRWQGRMLNTHPSLLPDYKGLNTYERALADGVTRFGCSVHMVTPELDDGPVLAQGVTRVVPTDTVETLRRRVQSLEHRIFPKALHLLAAEEETGASVKANIGQKPRLIINDDA